VACLAAIDVEEDAGCERGFVGASLAVDVSFGKSISQTWSVYQCVEV
jgi:hypothetical protein